MKKKEIKKERKKSKKGKKERVFTPEIGPYYSRSYLKFNMWEHASLLSLTRIDGYVMSNNPEGGRLKKGLCYFFYKKPIPEYFIVH